MEAKGNDAAILSWTNDKIKKEPFDFISFLPLLLLLLLLSSKMIREIRIRNINEICSQNSSSEVMGNDRVKNLVKLILLDYIDFHFFGLQLVVILQFHFVFVDVCSRH